MTPAHVLVVDDTPQNLRLLVDLLEASGYTVTAAHDGTEALARLAAGGIDLVLLDVVMPGMSGYDVCRAVRENPATRWVPVVLVTALDAADERVRGLDAGADDFLTKPIHRPELLARVRSLLRIKRLYDTIDDQARQLREWNERLERRVATQLAELERLGQLKRFLPPGVAELVLRGEGDDPLRSHRREIVVVALELRGFTAFADGAAPEDLLAVLQSHYDALGGLVLEHEATLARISGDGLTAFFNDPVPQADAPERAVALALALRDAGAALASRWARRGTALHVGIGVAQGYATLGAIGLDARSDYAAIGAVTQLAARLAEAAPPGEILLAQRALADVETQVEAEPTGPLSLRGFPRPVPAFRLLRAASGDALAPAAGDDPNARVFRREGEYWTVQFEGTACRLRDTKGLRYIAHLLARPDRGVHVLDLIGGMRGDAPEAMAAALGDAGPLLDEAAKAAYRARLLDLRAELSEAEARGEAGRVGAVQEEIDALTRQLAGAVGLGGRDRRAASATERGRVAVTRAITDALKRMRQHHPALERYLAAAIRTGTLCTYRPPDASPPPWRS